MTVGVATDSRESEAAEVGQEVGAVGKGELAGLVFEGEGEVEVRRLGFLGLLLRHQRAPVARDWVLRCRHRAQAVGWPAAPCTAVAAG